MHKLAFEEPIKSLQAYGLDAKMIDERRKIFAKEDESLRSYQIQLFAMKRYQRVHLRGPASWEQGRRQANDHDYSCDDRERPRVHG